MRGDLGAGREIGGSLGTMSQAYASSVSITYDNFKKLYTGELVSRGGLYRVEGPDTGSVSMQIDEILRYEYDEMMREIASQKPRDFFLSPGPKIEINGAPALVTQHTENGRHVKKIQESHGLKKGISNALDMAELSSMAISMLKGQWMEALMTAMSMAMQEYLSQHGHDPEPEIFTAEFGGIVIMAASRAMLMKLLQFQKNKRIQLIMNHMRKHDKEREEAMVLGQEISDRLLEKKEEARRKWRNQFSQSEGWRSKSLQMRKAIGESRERAQELWVGRV